METQTVQEVDEALTIEEQINFDIFEWMEKKGMKLDESEDS